MATQSLVGGIYFPSLLVGGGEPGVTALLLDASGEKAALIFQSPFTGNIRKLHFRTAVVTTGGTVDGRLETVSATDGNPTGTLAGTTTNGSVVVDSADDNVIKTATLTADAAVTRGTVYALVVVAGSPGNINIATFDLDAGGTYVPYSGLFTASWVKQARRMVAAIEDDAGVFHQIPGVPFFSTLTQRQFNNTSTPDVWGLRFQFPVPVSVRGCWINTELDGNATIKLYDSDGVTVLASVALDSDQRFSTAWGLKRLMFASTIALAKDTNYYLGLEPSSGTNCSIYTASLPSAAAMDTWDGGVLVHVASAKDPSGTGSWTHYNNGTDGYLRAWMGVELSAFDDGVGGGGSAGGAHILGGTVVR